MVEAMLHGWRAQQGARGLRVDTSEPRERLVRRCPRPLNSHVFSSMLRKNAWVLRKNPLGRPKSSALFGEHLPQRQDWCVAPVRASARRTPRGANEIAERFRRSFLEGGSCCSASIGPGPFHVRSCR